MEGDGKGRAGFFALASIFGRLKSRNRKPYGNACYAG